MIAWLRRARQTRTPVHNESSMQREKDAGLRLAFQTLASLQLTAQLLLWAAEFAYDRLRQTSWQAALLLALPAALLWFLWRRAGETELNGAARWTALLLLPNLWLDAYLCMLASAALTADLFPTETSAFQPMTVILFPLLSAWLCKDKGAAYGAYPLRWLFVLLAMFSTVFSGSDVSATRLFPLLGDGLGDTFLGTLPGLGAVWGVALLGLMPPRVRPLSGPPVKVRAEGRFLAIPLALCVLWTLWLSMLAPWQSGEAWAAGRKLAGLNQYGSSMTIYELGVLFWMLLLPFSLLGTLTTGKLLLQNAFPRLPGWLWPPTMLLPGAVLLAASPGRLPDGLAGLLPWRFVLSLGAGVGLLIVRRQRRKTS